MLTEIVSEEVTKAEKECASTVLRGTKLQIVLRKSLPAPTKDNNTAARKNGCKNRENF